MEPPQPLRARTLVAALLLIAFLAFVLPPALALWLQRTRVDRAIAQIASVSQALDPSWRAAARAGELADIDVLVGPGDPIVQASDPRWRSERQASMQRWIHNQTTLTPDPWLRPMMINVAAVQAGGTVWLLSAGPNGIIETAFTGGPVGGDDVAAALPVR